MGRLQARASLGPPHRRGRRQHVRTLAMPLERKTLRRGIATKLLAVFSLLLAIFAAASVSALVGLLELHRGLHSVEHDASRMQHMLELASAVRDQYAHMAHTIIIGDD